MSSLQISDRPGKRMTCPDDTDRLLNCNRSKKVSENLKKELAKMLLRSYTNEVASSGRHQRDPLLQLTAAQKKTI